MNSHHDLEVTPLAIRRQVERIHASEAFARSKRMQRFLKYIVNETLAGREDQLSEYAIGVAVFDRGPDFEPSLDPIVRNDARRLRLKLHEYYREQASGSGADVLIDVPKGGYVPVFRSASSCVREPLAGIQGTVLESAGQCHVIISLAIVPHPTRASAGENDRDVPDLMALQSAIAEDLVRQVRARFGLHDVQPKRLGTAA